MPGELIPQIIAAILSAVLLAISLLHFHWAGGGHWMVDATIPSTVDGKPLFSPTPKRTMLVAFGLAAGSLVALERGFLWPGYLPPHFLNTGCWIFSAIFAARVVGDFHFMGLFRRVRGTRFSRMDGLVYTPLSALFSLGFWALLVMQ